MSGLVKQHGRRNGEERSYNARRSSHGRHRNGKGNRNGGGGRRSASLVAGKEKEFCNGEVETRAVCAKYSKEAALPASESPAGTTSAPSSNLHRFLEATTPSVPAQYLPKSLCRAGNGKPLPYFTLGDLWESFREWSVYGAGVPLVLNESDGVVQYYVPYLSGIQLYGDRMAPSANPRKPGEDSDNDSCRDSSSDGSSDIEFERGYMRELSQYHPAGISNLSIQRLSSEKSTTVQEDFPSDDSDPGSSKCHLLYEFFEQDLPYGRQPLADKISALAHRFPGLKTIRSCDLLPCSWISVAWYPIYRIPTGPTLTDLHACFLTFHTLSTPTEGGGIFSEHLIMNPNGPEGFPMIPLPVFGLASYRFKASLWTPDGGRNRQLENTLLQAADHWLRLLNVDHPDYQFFISRGAQHR